MRIGLNLLFRLSSAGGGVETYVRRLVNELVRLDNRNEYTIFVSDRAGSFPVPQRGNASFVECNVDSDSRALRYLWEQTALPVQIMKHKFECFIQ